MNENFKKVASAAKAITGKSGTLWFAMVSFQQDFHKLNAEQLKEAIKGQEKEANAELRMKIGENSTYRVVKGVVIKAVELGIALVRKDGKAKGKTEVEKEIKEAVGDKSPADKFKSTMNTATLIEAKLDVNDVAVAAGLVKDLLDKMLARLRDLPSQA
jgi:hypothetical protein